MDGIWIVGPFIIKHAWLFIIAIVIGGLYLSKQLFHYELTGQKELKETYWNGIFYFFITFQFSTLLVYPTITIQDPIAVLAMPSGSMEWMIAWLFIFIYFLWMSWKKNLNRDLLFLYFFSSYMVIETVYLSFHPFVDYRSEIDIPFYIGHPVSLYQMILNVTILVIFLLLKRKKIVSKLMLSRLLVMYGGSHGLLSMIVTTRMMGVALPFWFYFLIALIGLFATSSMLKNNQSQELIK